MVFVFVQVNSVISIDLVVAEVGIVNKAVAGTVVAHIVSWEDEKVVNLDQQAAVALLAVALVAGKADLVECLQVVEGRYFVIVVDYFVAVGLGYFVALVVY